MPISSAADHLKNFQRIAGSACSVVQGTEKFAPPKSMYKNFTAEIAESAEKKRKNL
jgi:hypothetical protein